MCSQASVIDEGDVTSWDSYGDEKPSDLLRWKELVSAKRNGAKRISLGVAELDPGEAHLEHYHRDEEMVYFVLRGSGKIYLDRAEHVVSPGSAVYIPPKVLHRLVNTGKDALVFLWATDEAKLESLSTVWTE